MPSQLHPSLSEHYNIMTALGGPGLRLGALKELVTGYYRWVVGVDGTHCTIRPPLKEMGARRRSILKSNVVSDLKKLEKLLLAPCYPAAHAIGHWIEHAIRGGYALRTWEVGKDTYGVEEGELRELCLLHDFLFQLRLWVVATEGVGTYTPVPQPVLAALDAVFEYAEEQDDALGHK